MFLILTYWLPQTSVLEVVLNYQYQLSWSLLRLTIPISKKLSLTQLLLFPVFGHYLTFLVAECRSKIIFSVNWHGQLKYIISPSQLSAKAGVWAGAKYRKYKNEINKKKPSWNSLERNKPPKLKLGLDWACQ